MNEDLPSPTYAADPSTLVVQDNIVDCLMLGGIIAADVDTASKLWLLWRWHMAGCSHRWIPYHPAMVIELGYSDPDTGERLMRTIEAAGYVDVEEASDHRGWYFVRITERVWQTGDLDANQGTLFNRWNGEIPAELGRLTRLAQLMRPCPLLVTDRKTMSPTATLIAWIGRMTSPFGTTTSIEHAAWGRLLRLHHAQIQRAVKRLAEHGWFRLLMQGDGRSLIAWDARKFYWDHSQILELHDYLKCDPLAVNRLLLIVMAGGPLRAPSLGGAHALPAPDGPPCAPSPGGAHNLAAQDGGPCAPSPGGAHALPAPDGAPCAPSPGGAHALPAPDGAPCAPSPGGAHGLPTQNGAKRAPSPGGAHEPATKGSAPTIDESSDISRTDAAKAQFLAHLKAADATATVSATPAREVRFKIFEDRKTKDLEHAGQENIEHPTDKAYRIADTETAIIKKLGNGVGRLYPWFRFLVAAMVNGYKAQWYLRDGEGGDDRPLPPVGFCEQDLAAIIEFVLKVPVKDRSWAFIGVVKRRVLEIAGYSRDESEQFKQYLQAPSIPELRAYAREINYPWPSDRAMREPILTA